MAVCGACGTDNAPGSRFCSACGRPLASTGGRSRKIVTILFADVTGSTELGELFDPESVQEVMARYFDAVRAVVERHGGTVEKFIGDAVMAAFGIPVLHEDDALRAVRAAAEAAEAIDALNDELEERFGIAIRVRVGVNTGEVVAGDSGAGQAFATGDAVNLAARLQQAAEPGEILLGPETHRLVRDAVAAEPRGELAFKGKQDTVATWRLLSVSADAPRWAAAPRTPFLGREEELAALGAAYERCLSTRRCVLAAVVGPAGIGKSRLVKEFLVRASPEPRVLVGRSLPYGEGITYWPLVEIVDGLGVEGPAELAELVAAEPDGGRIAELVGGAIGLGGTEAPGEETRWAARRLFEAQARARPLVLVFDDVHWAEPTFAELVEHVARRASGPILLVCLARSDLVGDRLAFASSLPDAVSLALDPLPSAISQELVAVLAADEELPFGALGRIVEVGEGNPLFLEQMVAMRTEPGASPESELPPTIHTLLASRIDGLPPAERAVVERAAVEGRSFHRGAVAALLGEADPARLDGPLAALAAKELIRPDRAAFPGEEGFRFAHLLVRDAAYQLVPKEARAALHAGFARWLETTAGSRLAEFEEILGYHLEQAYRLRSELRPLDDEGRALGRAAAARLDPAGLRALRRGDLPAATGLLERAAGLLPEESAERLVLLPRLGAALGEAGRLGEAEARLAEGKRLATAVGDEALAARLDVERLLIGLQVETEAATAEAVDAHERTIEILGREPDHLGLCRAWRLLGLVRWLECSSRADEAWERAADHARLAGETRERADILSWLASSALVGPERASAAIRRCSAVLAEVEEDRRSVSQVLQPLAVLHAMTGEFALARDLLAEARELVADLGITMHSAVDYGEAYVAMFAGDYAAAETALRRGLATLTEMGEKALLSTIASLLADPLYAQGRDEEADEYTQLAAETAAPHDISAQVTWRRVRAKLLARHARFDEAERLAHEAVAFADRTDWLIDQADALLDLAEVLELADRRAGSQEAARRALLVCERKENAVGAERARARLARLAPRGTITT